MFDLFNQPSLEYQPDLTGHSVIKDLMDISVVSGLEYVPNFLTKEEEHQLLSAINMEHWLGDLTRRVQHYGYKYDYKARAINYSMFIGKLPNWAMVLANRLFDAKYIDVVPDQLIINEYKPGQGIANHIDCEPCFGDTIISISLGSACTMDFINVNTRKKFEAYLEPRSIVVLKGDARHKWTHGIAQRKSDVFNGVKNYRGLRVSMTFRKVILK